MGSLRSDVTSRDKPISFSWKADYEAISSFVELPAAKTAAGREAIAAIVYDAYMTSKQHPGRRISYSRRKDWYRSSKRYFGDGFGYSLVVPAIDSLVDAGVLVEHDKVAGGRPTGTQSSYLPNPDLSLLPLSGAGKRRKIVEPVRKMKDGILVDYRDTERSFRDRQGLNQINEMLTSLDLKLNVPGAHYEDDLIRFERHTVCTSRRELYRVFQGSWTLGGRLRARLISVSPFGV